jgi:hypothetical protein
VANHLKVSSDSHQWNISFIRAAYNWEVEVFTSFFNLLYSSRVGKGGEDKLFGSLPREDCSALDHSMTSLSPMVGTLFTWKCL